MVKIYKVLAISEVLGVSLFDFIKEEATPITTIDDIVTSTELDNPKGIPGLNIHIITTE